MSDFIFKVLIGIVLILATDAWLRVISHPNCPLMFAIGISIVHWVGLPVAVWFVYTGDEK